MKKLYSIPILALLALAFAVPCMAAGASGGTAFALLSSASGTVRTGDAINVRGFKTKTLTVTGATLTSNATTAVYKNMSGTFIVEQSPTNTAAGPWTTAIANDYAQTAASRTTNGTFTWSDAAAYIRLKWTGGTVGTKLKAWLNYAE
jgi:hypothetical protein